MLKRLFRKRNQLELSYDNDDELAIFMIITRDRKTGKFKHELSHGEAAHKDFPGLTRYLIETSNQLNFVNAMQRNPPPDVSA